MSFSYASDSKLSKKRKATSPLEQQPPSAKKAASSPRTRELRAIVDEVETGSRVLLPELAGIVAEYADSFVTERIRENAVILICSSPECKGHGDRCLSCDSKDEGPGKARGEIYTWDAWTDRGVFLPYFIRADKPAEGANGWVAVCMGRWITVCAETTRPRHPLNSFHAMHVPFCSFGQWMAISRLRSFIPSLTPLLVGDCDNEKDRNELSTRLGQCAHAALNDISSRD
jgi:hypothetical protein